MAQLQPGPERQQGRRPQQQPEQVQVRELVPALRPEQARPQRQPVLALERLRVPAQEPGPGVPPEWARAQRPLEREPVRALAQVPVR